MSTLRKQIERLGKADRPSIGFRPSASQKPRAMLLAAIASSAADAAKLKEAGADIIICQPADVAAVVKQQGKDASVGALVDSLDVAAAESLHKAGASFAISPLAETRAAAVDLDGLGFVPLVSTSEDEAVLRALAPLSCEAIAVEGGTDLSLLEHLQLVRVAMLGGAPLLVLLKAAPSVQELRALRDGGATLVALPAGTSVDDVSALGATLRDVPARRKRDEGGGPSPMVPLTAIARQDHDHDDDDDDD